MRARYTACSQQRMLMATKTQALTARQIKIVQREAGNSLAAMTPQIPLIKGSKGRLTAALCPVDTQHFRRRQLDSQPALNKG